VSTVDGGRGDDGITLRQAALTAGFGYLLMPVGIAEFSIWPKMVIYGDIERTIKNIAAHPRLFAVAILCYFTGFAMDIVIAWALYFLLAPVNRALSLLTAWFRLIYTAMAFVATLNLFDAERLLMKPEYGIAFGSSALHAQVKLLLDSYHWNWAVSLTIFAIHLVLLGYLIMRSEYIPRWIGFLIVIDGLGWMVSTLQPYFYPSAPLGWIFITYFGEFVLMFWLLIRGWKIREPKRPLDGATFPA
jgi:hypothetical protein